MRLPLRFSVADWIDGSSPVKALMASASSSIYSRERRKAATDCRAKAARQVEHASAAREGEEKTLSAEEDSATSAVAPLQKKTQAATEEGAAGGEATVEVSSGAAAPSAEADDLKTSAMEVDGEVSSTPLEEPPAVSGSEQPLPPSAAAAPAPASAPASASAVAVGGDASGGEAAAEESRQLAKWKELTELPEMEFLIALNAIAEDWAASVARQVWQSDF